MTDRILIADDDDMMRATYAVTLEHLFPGELSVNIVENGHQLLEEGKKGSYALIISDDNMPRMKGLEALTQLKEAGVKSSMTLVTSIMSDVRLGRITKSGISYVEKPIHPLVLKQIIETGIAQYKAKNGPLSISELHEGYDFQI